MNRVLLFEPDVELGNRCKEYLESKNYWVIHEWDRSNAEKIFSKQFFHLCVWRTETEAELKALAHLRKTRLDAGIIAASNRVEADFVVQAMREGASHYWNRGEGEAKLEETIRETLSKIAPDGLAEEIDFPFQDFIGRHPKIIDIFQTIISIKNTDSTVLITGESGTGKEVVATAIHRLSPRNKSQMVAINCGAIPASLIESELFGHMKGAFTGASHNRMGRFQMAGSGTLFLDEITDLPIDLQAKLLRAIQNKTFEPVGSPISQTLEARIIAATNQNLETAVEDKKFREDLFYRLNVIPIYIPPLRSRKSDIPLLVKSFMEKFSKEHQKPFEGISQDAMRALMDYQWPGNVRELENLIERVIVLKRNPGPVELKDLPVHYFKNVRLDRYVANVALPEDGLDFNDAVNEFENELILQALQKTNGNKNKAASLLNLNRTTLVEKLKRKGLRLAC